MRKWKVTATYGDIEIIDAWDIKEVIVKTKFNIINIASIYEIE